VEQKRSGDNAEDDDGVKSVLKSKLDKLALQIGYAGEY